MVKSVRAFGAKHPNHVIGISSDDKAKIPAGQPAVSRSVTLSKKWFFEGDNPEYPDHDYRSGILWTPNGYMLLLPKSGAKPETETKSARLMADELDEEEGEEEVENTGSEVDIEPDMEDSLDFGANETGYYQALEEV